MESRKMVLMHLFTGQQWRNRDTDLDKKCMDTKEEEEWWEELRDWD